KAWRSHSRRSTWSTRCRTRRAARRAPPTSTPACKAPPDMDTTAEQPRRAADPRRAHKLRQEGVRARPADARLRVFLFQLLCVIGAWERALNQLRVAGELDASTLAMVQTSREALQGERLREQVFAGQRVPLLMGEPQTWLALLLAAV